MSFYIQLNTGLIFKSESIIYADPKKNNGIVTFRDETTPSANFVFQEKNVVARWKDEVVVPEPTEEGQNPDT